MASETTSDDAVRQGEAVEAAAWQSVWEAAPDQLVRDRGMSCSRDGLTAVYRATAVPSWFFNRMVGLGIDRPARRDQVDAELARFRESGVQFGVCVVPGAQPAELPAWLEQAGLARTTTLARMVRDTRQLPDPAAEVAVRTVGREEARAFGDTVVRGFGMPPFCADWFGRMVGRQGWRTYLAYDAGEPVAAGALYVHGKVGWIGFGCTVADHRGRGIHRAVMARRMVDAADLGCRWLQTETNLAVADEPTPSLDNMKRLGFEMAYARANYVFTPPAA